MEGYMRLEVTGKLWCITLLFLLLQSQGEAKLGNTNDKSQEYSNIRKEVKKFSREEFINLIITLMGDRFNKHQEQPNNAQYVKSNSNNDREFHALSKHIPLNKTHKTIETTNFPILSTKTFKQHVPHSNKNFIWFLNSFNKNIIPNTKIGQTSSISNDKEKYTKRQNPTSSPSKLRTKFSAIHQSTPNYSRNSAQLPKNFTKLPRLTPLSSTSRTYAHEKKSTLSVPSLRFKNSKVLLANDRLNKSFILLKQNIRRENMTQGGLNMSNATEKLLSLSNHSKMREISNTQMDSISQRKNSGTVNVLNNSVIIKDIARISSPLYNKTINKPKISNNSFLASIQTKTFANKFIDKSEEALNLHDTKNISNIRQFENISISGIYKPKQYVNNSFFKEKFEYSNFTTNFNNSKNFFRITQDAQKIKVIYFYPFSGKTKTSALENNLYLSNRKHNNMDKNMSLFSLSRKLTNTSKKNQTISIKPIKSFRQNYSNFSLYKQTKFPKIKNVFNMNTTGYQKKMIKISNYTGGAKKVSSFLQSIPSTSFNKSFKTHLKGKDVENYRSTYKQLETNQDATKKTDDFVYFSNNPNSTITSNTSSNNTKHFNITNPLYAEHVKNTKYKLFSSKTTSSDFSKLGLKTFHVYPTSSYDNTVYKCNNSIDQDGIIVIVDSIVKFYNCSIIPCIVVNCTRSFVTETKYFKPTLKKIFTYKTLPFTINLISKQSLNNFYKNSTKDFGMYEETLPTHNISKDELDIPRIPSLILKNKSRINSNVIYFNKSDVVTDRTHLLYNKAFSNSGSKFNSSIIKPIELTENKYSNHSSSANLTSRNKNPNVHINKNSSINKFFKYKKRKSTFDFFENSTRVRSENFTESKINSNISSVKTMTEMKNKNLSSNQYLKSKINETINNVFKTNSEYKNFTEPRINISTTSVKTIKEAKNKNITSISYFTSKNNETMNNVLKNHSDYEIYLSYDQIRTTKTNEKRRDQFQKLNVLNRNIVSDRRVIQNQTLAVKNLTKPETYQVQRYQNKNSSLDLWNQITYVLRHKPDMTIGSSNDKTLNVSLKFHNCSASTCIHEEKYDTSYNTNTTFNNHSKIINNMTTSNYNLHEPNISYVNPPTNLFNRTHEEKFQSAFSNNLRKNFIYTNMTIKYIDKNKNKTPAVKNNEKLYTLKNKTSDLQFNESRTSARHLIKLLKDKIGKNGTNLITFSSLLKRINSKIPKETKHVYKTKSLIFHNSGIYKNNLKLSPINVNGTNVTTTNQTTNLPTMQKNASIFMINSTNKHFTILNNTKNITDDQSKNYTLSRIEKEQKNLLDISNPVIHRSSLQLTQQPLFESMIYTITPRRKRNVTPSPIEPNDNITFFMDDAFSDRVVQAKDKAKISVFNNIGFQIGVSVFSVVLAGILVFFVILTTRKMVDADEANENDRRNETASMSTIESNFPVPTGQSRDTNLKDSLYLLRLEKNRLLNNNSDLISRLSSPPVGQFVLPKKSESEDASKANVSVQVDMPTPPLSSSNSCLSHCTVYCDEKMYTSSRTDVGIQYSFGSTLCNCSSNDACVWCNFPDTLSYYQVRKIHKVHSFNYLDRPQRDVSVQHVDTEYTEDKILENILNVTNVIPSYHLDKKFNLFVHKTFKDASSMENVTEADKLALMNHKVDSILSAYDDDPMLQLQNHSSELTLPSNVINLSLPDQQTADYDLVTEEIKLSDKNWTGDVVININSLDQKGGASVVFKETVI